AGRHKPLIDFLGELDHSIAPVLILRGTVQGSRLPQAGGLRDCNQQLRQSWIIRVIEFEFLQDRDDLLGAYRVLRKATHKVERGLARKGGELFFRPQRAELLDRVLYR